MSQLLPIQSIPWADNMVNEKPDKDFAPEIQILKYMGNKRGLLTWLLPLLNEQLTPGDTFLDLFAGTSSVGYALKPKVKVIANDIQEYSSVISSALLQFNDVISLSDFTNELEEQYNENLTNLMGIFGKAVKLEEKVINTGEVETYNKYCTYVPKYGELVKNDKFKLNSYSKESFVETKRNSKVESPYLLFAIYFPNTFFSLKQCLEVDSIRYAIDRIQNKQKKAVYLSCLMFAISKAVNSSGHFAEYLSHTRATSLFFKQRKVSVLSYFLSKLSEFSNLYRQMGWKNQVFNMDYQKLIDKLHKSQKLKDIDLIYIDPPYTSAQYSRFYHIPETLVKYDYPHLTTTRDQSSPVKGRYRNDRHQSKFSQTTQVENTFREMFKFISDRTNATLAISYSDNSILKPVDKLRAIAKEFYEIIDPKNGYSHSAQGSKFKDSGKGNQLVHEYLLICKHKKGKSF